ncbi:MAG: phosphoribosylformimino-5-aminoimidazole carboxamide ribotide isomerase [Rhodospirillaceae bacterium]|nr:MAG: phosphoribosylformimino-5-aminoimidazole carboxamide ribotide isomerase [Rhodospirillaceae bacterium]
MILFPAIDLKDGACVRLLRGAMEQATVFNTSPADQARAFAAAGSAWLHVVDLNGAFAGRPVNTEVVAAILATVDIPVQLGGGIRDLATLAHWLEKGVRRVILGTVALRDPVLVKTACRRFPGQVAVGIDARGGQVAVEGWAETTHITAQDLALRFEDAGVAAIIHTDIDRDGVLAGPNVAASVALAERLTTPIIVSGGVAGLEDLKILLKAAASTPGLVGVISGRALYDGRLDLRAALALLAARTG